MQKGQANACPWVGAGRVWTYLVSGKRPCRGRRPGLSRMALSPAGFGQMVSRPAPPRLHPGAGRRGPDLLEIAPDSWRRGFSALPGNLGVPGRHLGRESPGRGPGRRVSGLEPVGLVWSLRSGTVTSTSRRFLAAGVPVSWRVRDAAPSRRHHSFPGEGPDRGMYGVFTLRDDRFLQVRRRARMWFRKQQYPCQPVCLAPKRC